ncbi:MAG: thioredoxin domain-containing protein [Candidatus Woesearchaeota archaeon]|nr:thioredoxin domain-containing protein [Candidatus Woesearchaeota archaeon]
MSEKINKLIIPFSIIIAGLIIGGAIYFSGKNSASPVATNNNQGQEINQPIQQPSADVDISKVKTSGIPFVGNANAPVVLATWEDFQCPFCKQLETTVIDQIVKDYPDKVKIVFKDFQFLGNDSQTAGIAGRAVWEVAPNKYFDWRMAIYDKQDNENSGWGSKDDIIALTKTILGAGNGDKVANLMNSKQSEYQKAIDNDKTEGGTFGINGTPGSIIGKNLISGAQPYSAFKQIIDLALQGQ